MKHIIFRLVLILLMTSPACVSAKYTSAKNIRYQKLVGQPVLRQMLDIHYQKTDVTRQKPVIVWVHGGAWKFGNKSHNIGDKANAFTDAGYVLVAVNYRFHPQASWKDQAIDVAAACQWITKNIRKYGGDPNRMILMGHSAGAHLAALTGADPSFLKAKKVNPSSIKGVVLLDGAGYDLPSVMITSKGQHLKLYREVFGNDPEQLKLASPFHHFKKGQNSPPYLIIPVASREITVTQSKRLAAKIKQTGGNATVFIAKNRTHMTLNKKIGEPDDAPTKAILDFLTNKSTAGIK